MQDIKTFQRAVAAQGRALLTIEAEDIEFALPKGFGITIKRDDEWGDRATVTLAGTPVCRIEESYGVVEFHSELGVNETEERLAKLRALAMRLIETAETVRAAWSADHGSNATLEALDAFEPEQIERKPVPTVWAAGHASNAGEMAFHTGPCRSRADAVSQMDDGDVLVGMSREGEVLTVGRMVGEEIVDVPGGLDDIEPAMASDEDPVPV